MSRRLRRSQRSSWLVGSVGGALVVWGAQALVSVDWRPITPPLDHATLVIRHDAKGEGHFGASRSGNRRHRGVDLEAPRGSAVRAIRSGQVTEIGTHRGLGRFVELAHRHHLQSLYAHLDTVGVAVGDRVRQGQVIATVGKTGNARHPWIVPHLHLEVHRDGSPIDPATLGLVVVEPATTTGVVSSIAPSADAATREPAMSARPDDARADGGE